MFQNILKDQCLSPSWSLAVALKDKNKLEKRNSHDRHVMHLNPNTERTSSMVSKHVIINLLGCFIENPCINYVHQHNIL